MATILFICTGNICRSAMAEGIARTRLDDASLRFGSAGTWAGRGNPATGHAVTAASAVGADIRDHRSRPLDEAVVAGADRVYGMTAEHVAAVPGAELLDPSGREIEDPYGRSAGFYAEVCDRIAVAITARADDWRSLTR